MHFSAHQVVFIEHNGDCLYSELIQTMEDRHTCWLRPLSLCVEEPENKATFIVDLRNGPDIICPTNFIQPVLDTEWLCVLEKMAEIKESCSHSRANQHLRKFLQTLLSPKTKSVEV